MGSTSRPLVSVCIPTRNRAGMLRAAIASALAEPIEDLEVVVSDDASEDGTPEVVRSFGDRRVRYARRERPSGIARNRNACLEAARGRYLAWLDDDDAYLAGGLARQVAVLEREPDVVLAHGSFEVIDGDGRPQPPWSRPFEADTIETGERAFRELLLSNYVGAPTVVVRAAAQRRAGPYAPELGDRGEDWDAWLRIALRGDLAYAATPVAVYRCHPGGASHGRVASLAWLRSEARVTRRALRAGGFAPEARAALARRARAALGIKAVRAATEALVRGRARAAARAVCWAGRAFPPSGRHLLAAAGAAADRDEHAFHVETRRALRAMLRPISDSRFGRDVRARLEATEAWAAERAAVAHRIRRAVPAGARVLAVDKWDPSLLREAGRRGGHFPDLGLHPRGYPADDADAIRHLAELRARGAEYLVFPRAGFWWLEHYDGFARHLAARHERVWADETCVIYRLDIGSGRGVSGSESTESGSERARRRTA